MVSSTYDPVAYWRESGREPFTAPKGADEQEQAFRVVLRTLLTARTILDYGCGNGRMSAILREEFPSALIVAVDLSEERIDEVRARKIANLARVGQVEAVTGHYDLIVASEVLLHQPPDSAFSVVEALRAHAETLLHIDWYESCPVSPAPWCFMHDFARYYDEHAIGYKIVELPKLRQRIYIVEGAK